VKLFIPAPGEPAHHPGGGKAPRDPRERVFVDLERYGNTSAASIPIALAEAKEQGRFAPGDLVLAVAFGGGSPGPPP